MKSKTVELNFPQFENQFVVFINDLAQCSFRGDYESDAEWRHERTQQDEEGAIGYVMAHKLKGAIEYESYRFLCECSSCTDAIELAELMKLR